MAETITRAEYMRNWRAANPEKAREIGRRSDKKRSKNPERRKRIGELNKIHYHNDLEFRERIKENKRIRLQDPEVRERGNALVRARRKNDTEWREKDKAKKRERRQKPEVKLGEREYRRTYERKRYSGDIQFRLTKSLRNRLRHALKGDQKAGSAVSDLGCSIVEFKLYIENQFDEGMTWDNYGSGEGKWNIDHVIPLSSFDLTDRTQFLEACNWLNLQPMWQPDNIRKGATL